MDDCGGDEWSRWRKGEVCGEVGGERGVEEVKEGIGVEVRGGKREGKIGRWRGGDVGKTELE